MSALKSFEIGAFEELLCFSAGYVLDFSTDKFDTFTYESIGIALCDKYRLSKWKSLAAFLYDKTTTEISAAKLLEELLDYYYMKYGQFSDDERKKTLYKQCREIVKRLTDKNSVTSFQTEKIKETFDSEYINKQIEQMNKSINTHPDDAIGKAKELLESCCKTILKEKGVAINRTWDVIQLNKETCKILKLTPDNIADSTKAGNTIKAILGSLSCISHGMAELRNHYGTGHGKDAKYKGLTSRHALLAVGAAVTAINFLWDTHKEQKNKKIGDIE